MLTARVDTHRNARYLGDIVSDTSQNRRDRASRLLLKAIRSLPDREQDVVVAYLLDRSLAAEPMTTTREYTRAFNLRPSLMPALHGAQIEVGQLTSWRMRDAALILHRLAAGATVAELAGLLGLDPELLTVVLHDLAKRHYGSDRLDKIFHQLADGKSIAEIADQLGVTEHEIVDELEPTEQLTSTVCAVLTARAALPSPPLSAVGAFGRLRTMPVRFPEQQYERLKAWCEEHNFPMAVVVRGVVERFLDEQQPAP
jgi:hypothetical protein